MKYDASKVANYVANMEKRDLSAQEMIAVGKVLQQLGEVQKETDYLDEYMQATLIQSGDFGGGTMN